MFNRTFGNLPAQSRNSGRHVVVRAVSWIPPRDAPDDCVQSAVGHAVGTRTRCAQRKFDRTPTRPQDLYDKVPDTDGLRPWLGWPVGRLRTQILRLLLHIKPGFRPRLDPSAILQPKVGLQHG